MTFFDLVIIAVAHMGAGLTIWSYEECGHENTSDKQAMVSRQNPPA